LRLAIMLEHALRVTVSKAADLECARAARFQVFQGKTSYYSSDLTILECAHRLANTNHDASGGS